ncbi:MAG: nucleoside triphosphate pyrophosphohydrolase [Terriglobales bacterium]
MHPDSPTIDAAFARVVEIMRRLRAPGGCPWDRQQTYDSIRQHTLEETYEVLEAIGDRNWDGLREELGDLLLQVVFYAEMAEEDRRFDIGDVLRQLADKLIRRHPHVFAAGGERGLSPEQALGRWNDVKAREKAQPRGGAQGVPSDLASELRRPATRARSAQGASQLPQKGSAPASRLSGIPRALPALAHAAKLGQRAAAVGFDWPDAAGVHAKVREEVHELECELAGGSREKLEDELGDVLFSLCQLARHAGLEPESALKRANRKFERRFQHMESAVVGQELSSLSAAEWDRLWNEAKRA